MKDFFKRIIVSIKKINAFDFESGTVQDRIKNVKEKISEKTCEIHDLQTMLDLLLAMERKTMLGEEDGK